MKKIFVVFGFVVVGALLIGCNSINASNEVWSAVNEKEFSNYTLDVGIGSGLYFYEKGASKHCLYMIHGSGPYIIGYIDYEISLDDEGFFSILSASAGESDFFSDPSLDENFVFQYGRKGIQFGGGLYEETSHGINQQVFDLIEQIS